MTPTRNPIAPSATCLSPRWSVRRQRPGLLLAALALLLAAVFATPAQAQTSSWNTLEAQVASGEVLLRWQPLPTPPGVTVSYAYQQRIGSGRWSLWTDETYFTIKNTAGGLTTKFTGLTNGTQYSYKIRATRSEGVNPLVESNIVTATPSNAKPGKPTLRAAATNVGEITLYWELDGPAVDVTIHWSEVVGTTASFGTSESVGVWPRRWRRTGLTAGTRYAFKVKAWNDRGGSPSHHTESDSVTVLAPATITVPEAPTNLRFPIRGNRKVKLVWTAPSASGAGAADLTYEYRARRAMPTRAWPDWSTTGTPPGITEVIVGNLLNDFIYQFQVRAVNAKGPGEASEIASDIPRAPTVSFTVQDQIGNRNVSATSSWIPASGSALRLFNFQWRYAPVGSSLWEDWEATPTGRKDFVANNGVPNFGHYKFQMRAETNLDDFFESQEVEAHFGSIAAPTGLGATPGDSEATLNWNGPAGGTVTKYQYRQRAGSGSWGNWTDTGTTPPTATSATVTGLSNGTTYTFQVRAVTSAGSGLPSATKTVTPPGTPPGRATGLTGSLTDIGSPYSSMGSEVTLSWTAPAGIVGGYQYRYQQQGAGPWSAWTATGTTPPTATTAAVNRVLSPGETYNFQVRAVTGPLTGPASNTIAIEVPVVEPTGLTATAGDEQVTLTWTAPVTTDDITKYQYRQSTDAGANWGAWTDASGLATSHTVTGLTNGTTYTFQLRAVYDPTPPPEVIVASATATATPVGVIVSVSALTVNENGSATYTVVLTTRPTGTVSVRVAKQSGDDPNLTASPTLLRFTRSNWSTPKTVTVRAANDVDSLNGTATFTHSASGGGYDSVSIASVMATEADDDTPGVQLSRTALTVSEGRSATYTVKLNTQPTAAVTVTPAATGDSDLTFAPSALTFATSTWSRAQTVTVSAAEDDDAADGQTTIAHTAASGDSAYNGITPLPSVTATEDDNDTAGVTVTPARLTVNENGSATYTVVLDTLPTAAVTVGVAASGDSDLSVSSAALTFTTGNWNTAQTVTVSAADDVDPNHGTATIAHTASGADEYASISIASVTATEADDDTPGVKVSPNALAVKENGSATYTVELNTQPRGNVTVRLSRTGDSDLTVVPTALIFTTANWSTAQTAIVSAADDDDADDGKASIRHRTSGSGYSGLTATLTATEEDDDTLGLTVSASTLTVNENGSATYTVVLDTRPTGTVTVSVGKPGGGDPHLTRSPTSLKFTASNWNRPKTVTVSAADDSDDIDGTATFTHRARGGGYDSASIVSVTATEVDDDKAGVRLSTTSLTVPEGGSASFTIELNAEPPSTVVIHINKQAGGDPSVTTRWPTRTFFPTNWATKQTVTVRAAQDADAADGAATYTFSAAGTDYASVSIPPVTVTVLDDDTAGVTVSESDLTVNEGGTAAYTVVLDRQPTAAVTVTPTATGDSDLGVSGALTFTTANWNTAQTVTVSAAEDLDPDHGEATIVHTASGAGEYVGVAIDSVIATEADDDTPGLNVSTTALTVTEGGSATYTVELNTLPPGNVTVTVSRRTGDRDLTVSPAALTFTTANWNTAQTATVSAAEDDDAAVGTATIRNRASGSGYSGLTAELTATEDDNDTAGVTVSASTLTVNENGSATYTVVLDTRPTGTVRVAVGKAPGGDPSLTRSPTSLTFTVSNWSTPKTVTVRAADDADSLNGTATFTHTATSTADSDYAGIDIADVEATERDDDMPGVRVSRNALTVSEGRSATYTVKLNTLPTGSVTVAVTASGDSDDDLTAAPTSLTFTTGTWNAAQTVTVSAADDGDAEDGTATFANVPSGAGYTSLMGAIVTATEDDDDTAGVTVTPRSLTVNENGSATYTVVLDTLPTAAVTVGVAASGDSDSDLTVSATSLTFTTGNWSTAQTVSVTAANDDDSDHGEATIAHTASGADEYADVTIASVTATEKDDDTPGLNVSTNTLTVSEGGSATYTVVLNTLPPGNVTVRLSRTGDSDLTVSPAALTFTTANWNTAQTATVSAAEDDDAADGTATIRNRASGTGYTGLTAELEAKEDDNDTAGVTVSESTLTVNENGRATYTVVLHTRPTGTVRVAVAKADGGDPNLSARPTSLTFTVSNWSTPKTVTVRAANDVDGLNGEATFTHTATSSIDSDYADIAIASVTATEADDDTKRCSAGSTAVSAYSGAGIVADCTTLLGLKDELRGTTSLNWSPDTPMANWHGITVSGNRVTELDSKGKEFRGSIPSELGQLTSLTKLAFYYTGVDRIGVLSGPIPPDLGRLTNLETLSLYNISVSGSIPPDLGRLTRLKTLKLYWNDNLSGSIPPELGQLTSLEVFEMSAGVLGSGKLSGPIPSELGRLTSLTLLDLNGHQLSGSIPPELGQLTNLTNSNLILANNRLSGCIPVAVSRFTNINPQQGGSSLSVCPNAAPAFGSADAISVAENATAVVTVTATDEDDSDNVTGFTLTGGADQALFSFDAGTGALTFTSAPNYEAPADTDTDNAYLVEVTATSGTGAREKTTVQAITVTVTDVDGEAPSAPATPAISSVTATGFTVTWTAPENTGPAITDYAVQYRAGTSGTWTDAGHSGTGLTVAVTGLAASTSYQVQVQATNDEGPSAWSATATGRTTVGPGVTVSASKLTVSEGRSATYTVKLKTQPTAAVTVTPTAMGDSDLTFAPAALTFTTANWRTAQAVTVSAADDGDAADGRTTIEHTATSTDSAYNGITPLPSVTATEDDDDTAGVTVSPRSLTVNETGSETYTVVLNTLPTAAVTVGVAASGDSDLTVSATSLTFTTGNWNTAQTVTVSAADDDDPNHGRATIAHTASGASEYADIAIASVTATEADDDTPGVKLSTTALTVSEGGSATYTVVLNTLPPGNVTVTVSRTGDSDLTVAPARLTFTTDNWNTAQTATVSAAEDDDAADGTATIRNRASGSGYSGLTAELTATEDDNDTASVTVTPTELTVNENGSEKYTVVLDTRPTGTVRVAVGKESGGDPSLTRSPTSLTFTVSNWSTPKTVTVRAADDVDSIDGTATFAHTATSTADSDYAGITIADVEATEADDDTPGVRVSRTTLTVSEGRSATYTVALNTLPTGSVTVTVAASGDSDSDLTTAPTSLTFTTTDWNRAQTVTVSAADDDDAEDGTATFANTPSGADYASATAAIVTATEDDNDTAGVTVTPTRLTVNETGSATYTVVLNTLPTAAVTVGVTASGDSDLTVSATSLTFSTANWNTAQTVTVSAADDDDPDHGTATIAHTASGASEYADISIASVAATEADDDTPGVKLSTTALRVSEGGSANYTVVLNTLPPGNVTVSLSRTGDSDLTVSPTALTFTTANWNTAQTATVSAAADADAADGTATIAHRASGSGYSGLTAELTATEDDNDTAGVTVTPTELTVNENGSATYTVALDTRPAGTVRVAVGKEAGGDPSLTRSPTSLTFTVSNWSTPKTVTVRAADDVDSTDGTATFAHTATSSADSAYDGISIADVEATEADDDTPGVRVSRNALTVSEGRSATYTVKLNTLPTGSVTVAVTASGDSDLTAAPTSLTFTTTDWNRAQTVTVSAADDGDAEDGTATFTNTPSGADYASVTGVIVTATEDDDDTAGVTVTPRRLTVNETGSATYTVVLDTLPTAAVTVGVAASGDSDLTVSTAALTFTTGNWNTAQTVTVSAADDDDPDHGTATIAHTASGAGEYADVSIASVIATEADDDTPGVQLSTNALTVTEGGSATYTVVLNTLPPGNVTVTLSRRTGDRDLTVSPTKLTFTTDNWSTAQTATVSAAEDDDAAVGTATIRNLASGSGYSGLTAELTATEDDNDTAGVTVSDSTLTVNENGRATYTVVLDTRPTGTVRVAVATKADSDPSLTRSPTSLTFSVSNWSTPKTVTVRAADDADSLNGTATFTHTATSTADSDYAGIDIADVEATERDDDMPGVRVSRNALTVSEGRSATYTVKLNTLPTGSVTVAVTASGDSDGDLTAAPTSLTFTTTDWNRAQTVTVSAADDGDAEDGTATFTNTPSGADYASVTGAVVTATEDDGDTAGVTVTPARLTVNENGSETYTVVLNTLPTAAVTVGVAASGDSDLTVSATSLTFSTANWNTAQTVTVSAADDDDPNHGTATIAHTASGASEYADISIASVAATEADDDTPGVKLSTNALTVTEGGSATYTVVLNTLPPGTVTVTLSRTGDSDLTVSPARLTFTTDNWSTAQTATVSAAEDDDAAAGTATIRNRASGSGYTGLTATLTATEDDNDTAGVTVSASTLTVNENGRATYTVVLDTRPTGTVRVAVAKTDDSDPSLTRSPTSLTFTASNWSTPKTVTVRAADDADSLNGTATFTHAATSSADSDYNAITIASVEATEADDDTPGLKLSRTSVTVSEGRSATYTVALNTLPTGSVTVAVTASGDSDSDLTTAPTSLTFTTTDWNRAQTVTVSAADDGDAEDGTATFTNTPSGADYASVTGAVVTATEDDDDTAGVTVSPTRLTVNENGSETYTVVLDTLPTAAVTVGVAASGDSDLTVSATSLTFSTANWSTAQTVSVTAANDDDPNHGTATIAHTASGASEYAGVTIASVTATEADDDTPGVKLSTTALMVAEGGSATYTVVLNTLPPGNVTVTVSRTGDSDLTVAPARLTFTTDNWNTAQTATVSAAEDDDAADGTATIRNRASGSGYSGLTAELTATEDDNDTASVTVTPTELTVNENGSEKYTVVLHTRPTGTVRVSVGTTDDSDPSLTRSPTSLTFTVSNWSTPKTVTVRAADDGDSTNDTATFTHTATSSADSDYDGISVASVEATEADDDMPGLKLSRNALTVSEGRSATYTVKLNTAPTAAVTVTPSAAGDSDLTLAPAALTFTTGTWSRAQTVTVSAADDGDTEDGTATITHTAASTDGAYNGITVPSVTATEDDNDTAGVTVTPKTLRVSEGRSATYTVVLQTVPTGDVTVTVAKRDGGDDDLTVPPTSLTFTTGSWNTAQTVTVSAAEDADTANGAATITHTASSTDSDYNGITNSVRAREADNDAAANAAPTFTSGATFTVAENETAVGTVVATDSDAGDRITGYALTGGADRAQFSITRAGALTFDTAPDYESPVDADTDNVYVVVVEATSGASGRARTATQTLTVTVTDVDEAPSVPSAPSAPAVSGETADSVTVSWTAPANPGPAIIDYDVQYRVSGAASWTDAGHSGTGLTLTLTGLTASTDYEVQVRASNAEGPGAWSASATATTTAVNVAPTFTSGAMFTVAENETAVGTVVAMDSDAGDSITGYALTGGADQAKFSITSAGALTFDTAPDYESPADADTDNAYVVVVEATSGAGERVMTATQAITVTVTDQSEVPSAPSAPTISGETADSLTVSWTAPANPGSAITDYDVQYRVSGAASWTDAGHSGTGLTLTLTGLTASTDYEVQVRATNAEGPGAWSATATATTTAVNVAPTFTSGAMFTVAENETAVGTVVAMDSDAGDTLTGYALTGGADRAKFSITSAGALTFNTAPDYESPTDADTDNAYVVVVEATSGAGERVMTATQTLTVTVTDQSEVPSAPSAPTISGETADSVTVTWTAPANPGPAIIGYDVQYRVSGAASWTDAGHSGTGLTLTLTGLTASTDYEVQVRASNAEGPGAWSASATATTTTTAVNVAPTFTSGAMFTVAENETAVGTVVAMDADADDTLTGYALTGGADRAQFSITSAGALTFTSAPDYESPTDADTDNAYVVVVEATSGEGERVMTATQAITVTVTDQSEVPSAPSAPVISGETASSLTVTWTAPANPGSAITDYDVQYRVSGAASWTDAGHSGTGLTLTLTDLTAITDYEVQVRASSAEGTGAWSASATATTTANEAAERIERAAETVQPEVSRAMVSETLEVVTQRIERPGDGQAQVSLSGRSSFSELLQSHEAALNGEVELDWRRVLGTSSFSLPLSETDQPGAGGGLEVWGRGAWRSLSGGSAGELTWKGEMLSAHLGADWRLRRELLAGVALSWHEGDVDYDVVDGTKRVKGTSRSRMTSVHPYLGWFPSEGSSLWMSAGYGRGTVEVDDEGRHSGDSEMRMVGAGGRVRVLSSEGWLGGGTSSLDVKGEGWVARTEISGNGGMLADDTVDARRVRLALEGAHERRLASGSVLTPVLELGVRHDGGDGETGVGVEIGAGLRYADAVAGLSSEVRVRALAAHQGTLDEWGVSGTVRYAPGASGRLGASGRGVSFSVTSSLGAPGSGTERLWEQGLGDDPLAVVEDDKAVPSALRLESELGYGFSAMGGAGVLTPYGGFTFSEENARRYRLGVRLERSPALSLELKVERSETTTDTDHGLFLKGTVRW